MFGKIVHWNFWDQGNYFIETDKGIKLYIDIPSDKEYYSEEASELTSQIRGSNFISLWILAKNSKSIHISPFSIINLPQNIEFEEIVLNDLSDCGMRNSYVLFSSVRKESWGFGQVLVYKDAQNYPLPVVSLRSEKCLER